MEGNLRQTLLLRNPGAKNQPGKALHLSLVRLLQKKQPEERGGNANAYGIAREERVRQRRAGRLGRLFQGRVYLVRT